MTACKAQRNGNLDFTRLPYKRSDYDYSKAEQKLLWRATNADQTQYSVRAQLKA